MRAIELTADDLRLVILPELGGGIARFDLIRPTGALPLFRPWDDSKSRSERARLLRALPVLQPDLGPAGSRPAAASGPSPPISPMSPIRSMATPGRNPGRLGRPARARSLSPSRAARCRPSFIGRSLSYALDDDGLLARLSVTHRGDGGGTLRARPSPMAATDAGDHVAGGGRSGLARATGPPAGSMPADQRAPGVGLSARRGPLPRSWINNGFAGWRGRARIRWPERGLGLEIEASDALETYVLFSPGADAGFFCFEPVSHAVDAFHLPGGPQAHGLELPAARQFVRDRMSFPVTDAG